MLKRPERESEAPARSSAAVGADDSSKQVSGPQRGYVLTAMRESIAAQGYASTTVSDVAARAGVSRKTFYEFFVDKKECFDAVYEEITQHLLDLVAAAIENASKPEEAVQAGVDALLGFLAQEAGAASICVVEVLATGEDGSERRGRTLERLAGLFEQPLGELRPDAHVAQSSAQALVGGVYELAYDPVVEGKAPDLPALRTVVTEGWSAESESR